MQNGQIRIAWADGDANDRNKQPEVVALVRRFVDIVRRTEEYDLLFIMISNMPQREALCDRFRVYGAGGTHVNSCDCSTESAVRSFEHVMRMGRSWKRT